MEDMKTFSDYGIQNGSGSAHDQENVGRQCGASGPM
uniref:Ubiquitin-like domain-containing protein n=1 Tax=Anguilla anguilla TaxID=7936 RepID=A0A0E9RWY7_ANGAN